MDVKIMLALGDSEGDEERVRKRKRRQDAAHGRQGTCLHKKRGTGMMRSVAESHSKAGATTQTTQVRKAQAERPWTGANADSSGGVEAGPASTLTATHSMASVLQRCGKKKSNNKKQEKQKAAAKQAEKSRQSKADRNVLRAAQYGDSGRRKDVQEIVRKKGKEGQTIAHGFGSSGSGTSNKYDTIIKKALDEAKNGGK